MLGKFLIGICQFRSAHPQVFNCHLIILTQAAADLMHHCHGNAGTVLQHTIKPILVEFQHDRIRFGFNSCGTRRIMDKRHLSEKIPRVQGFQ